MSTYTKLAAGIVFLLGIYLLLSLGGICYAQEPDSLFTWHMRLAEHDIRDISKASAYTFSATDQIKAPSAAFMNVWIVDVTGTNANFTNHTGTQSTVSGGITAATGDIEDATIDQLQLSAGVWVGEFSNDGTLSGNSDVVVPTEKAVKTYADALDQTTTADPLTLDTINGRVIEATETLKGAALTVDGTAAVGGNANFDSNVIFGDASGDTVTFNAATWTLANDAAVALSGGLNGLNFDSNTLSIDAANHRIGAGTDAPSTTLHVNGDAYVGNTAFSNPNGWGEIIDIGGGQHACFQTRTSTIRGGFGSTVWGAFGSGAGVYVMSMLNHPLFIGSNSIPSATVETDGDWWFRNDVSAQSFSDRTPSYEGDALTLINGMKSIDGKIAHATLGPARVIKYVTDTYTDIKRKDGMLIKRVNGNHDNKSKKELLEHYKIETILEDVDLFPIEVPRVEEGRDLGMSISINQQAIRQLLARIEALEARIAKLEGAALVPK